MYDLNQILSTAQTNLAKPTENQLAKAKYYGYTDEQVNQEIQGQQIPNQTTSMPVNAPTTMPLNGNNNPVPAQPAPQPPVQPAPAPQVAGTTTQAPQPELKPTGVTTPQAQVESDILPPSVTGYVNPNQAKLEQANLNKFNSNLSVYSTGKSLYDAVQGGSLLPGTKEFTDLTTRNPQVLAEYNQIKAEKDKIDTVNTLGKAILGETITPKPNNALEQLVSFFTKSMDTDVASEYQNSVINNPAYQASIQAMNGINQQIADNNKNINALRTDVRNKYSAGTPESLIASAIAREARPLIEQGQYLSELQKNAQSEMTRLFEENKQVFDLKQEERNTKNQRMIDLYGTIRQEEIRQEDFARADKKLADEIARAEKTDKAKALELEQERVDNVKIALAQLGVKPVGATYDELLGEYATAVKNKPKESKTITGLKAGDYYIDNGELKQVPAGGGVSTTQPSGRLIAVQAGNKNVQVDEVGAEGLQNAFAVMKNSGIKFLTGAAHRDQAETIKAMGDRVGMPGATAAQLRAAGHQIADVGSSKHEGGLAIDLYSNDNFGAPTQAQIEIMERNGWIQGGANGPIPGDLGHFEYVGTQNTTIDPTIESILNGALNIKDLPTDQRAEVANKVNAYLNEQTKNITDKDEAAIMRSAVYTKGMSDTTMQKIGKINTVRQQLGDVTALLNSESTGPILGILKSNNPYDTKAQQIKTAIQALVPNLARGVFGEVGVLTDSDIENYSKTVPNLKSTKELNDAILEMINKTLGRTFSDTIATAAKNKENVSQFIDDYRQNKGNVTTPVVDKEETQNFINEKLKTSTKEELAKYLISKGIDPSEYDF